MSKRIYLYIKRLFEVCATSLTCRLIPLSCHNHALTVKVTNSLQHALRLLLLRLTIYFNVHNQAIGILTEK